jgi:hypothetical protein
MQWTPAHTEGVTFIAACGLGGSVMGFLVALFSPAPGERRPDVSGARRWTALIYPGR